MTAAELEIVEMYDNCDMSVDEIVSETGYDIVAIKNTLVQSSKKYKKDIRENKSVLITDEEDKRLVQGIKDLAFYGENEAVRLRALMYAHDEKHGRNDKQKASGININVLMLNKALKQAQELSAGCSSIIDVEDVKSLEGSQV